MKVLIVSDSHGMTNELHQLKERHREEVDLLIHCGDSELPDEHKAIEDFIVVRGNCDYGEEFPTETLQAVGDCNIFITHGHLYSVKTSLVGLSMKSRELGADVACFGHSHLLGAEMVEGVLFINPGSLRLPRGRRERTYVILEILEDSYVVNVYDFDTGKMNDLTMNVTR
jgi:uncharacterized protein